MQDCLETKRLITHMTKDIKDIPFLNFYRFMKNIAKIENEKVVYKQLFKEEETPQREFIRRYSENPLNKIYIKKGQVR